MSENLHPPVENDSVIFDDDVPEVVKSRYRLLDKLVHAYGGNAQLYGGPDHQEIGVQDHLIWLISVSMPELGLEVPIPAAKAEDFLAGLRSLHEIFELLSRKGLRLSEILNSSSSGLESLLIKSTVAPDKGG